MRYAIGVCGRTIASDSRRAVTGLVLFAIIVISLYPAIAGSKTGQPIEFPHDIHAGKLGINCMYCHTYARRSAVAGIPSTEKCIGCHQNIDSVRDKPRIQTLFAYWQARQPIPWRKIHDVPDFVRFNHERHIQRFYFQQGRPVEEVCALCHGDMKLQTVAERTKPLTMGWCVSCHEQDHRVSASSAATTNGPNDCSYCHK